MSNINALITSLNSKIEKLMILHRQSEEERMQLLAEREDLLIIIRELKHKQDILEQSFVQSGPRVANSGWTGVHAQIDHLLMDIEEALSQKKKAE
jgi:hypothetical protein